MCLKTEEGQLLAHYHKDVGTFPQEWKYDVLRHACLEDVDFTTSKGTWQDRWTGRPTGVYLYNAVSGLRIAQGDLSCTPPKVILLTPMHLLSVEFGYAAITLQKLSIHPIPLLERKRKRQTLTVTADSPPKDWVLWTDGCIKVTPQRQIGVWIKSLACLACPSAPNTRLSSRNVNNVSHSSGEWLICTVDYWGCFITNHATAAILFYTLQLYCDCFISISLLFAEV